MNFTDFLRPTTITKDTVSNYNPVYSSPEDLPTRRSSAEQGNGRPGYQSLLVRNTKFIGPTYNREFIPVIRKLAMNNPDVGLALFDAVQLTNTGFRIKFDPSVSADDTDKMRKHLQDKSRTWGYGGTGLQELVNKFIRQAYIGGAISLEWVIDRQRKGIKDLVLVNPETIEFAFKDGRWAAYQRVTTDGLNEKEKLIKLNQFTYKYIGLNSDSNIPYGIPPYMTAMDSLARQINMGTNIDFVLDQLGILGFLEALVEKPSRRTDENQDQYQSRLQKLLTDTKTNTQSGFKQGMVVGFKGDHEFEFHSTSKDLNGVEPIVKMNEVQVANGLKTSPVFLGIPVSGSESGMSVTFTKMLSQLTNTQNTVALALEYGLALELRLAGFNFKYLSIQFNPSTITDDLKFQQAREIKLRNLQGEYDQGLISQEQFADQLGYEKPDQPKPRVERDPTKIAAQVAKERGDAGDAKSDRKARDKKKPVPKRKDNSTKER